MGGGAGEGVVREKEMRCEAADGLLGGQGLMIRCVNE